MKNHQGNTSIKEKTTPDDIQRFVEQEMTNRQYCPRKMKTLQLKEMLFDENLINANLKILFSAPRPTIFKKPSKPQQISMKSPPLLNKQSALKVSIDPEVFKRLQAVLKQHEKVVIQQSLSQLCTMKFAESDSFQ